MLHAPVSHFALVSLQFLKLHSPFWNWSKFLFFIYKKIIIVINVIPRVLSSEEGDGKVSKGWEQCKRGYLRIKQKGFPKARWPLLVRCQYFFATVFQMATIKAMGEIHQTAELRRLGGETLTTAPVLLLCMKTCLPPLHNYLEIDGIVLLIGKKWIIFKWYFSRWFWH